MTDDERLLRLQIANGVTTLTLARAKSVLETLDAARRTIEELEAELAEVPEALRICQQSPYD